MRVTADGKVHRTKAEWAEIFCRFEESGLSKEEFCKEADIQLATFARWHRKLKSPQRRSKVSPAKTDTRPTKESFVELAPPSPESTPWSIELELPGGCVLRLRS